MKESFWTYLVIALGLFIIVVLILVQDLTTTAEEDYYLMKEVMEAAMIDSVDYGIYRSTGEIRIIEEKFVEVIEEWRKNMNLDKILLLGHHMGGFLATSYAISHPER